MASAIGALEVVKMEKNRELFDWRKKNNRGGPPYKKPRHLRKEEVRDLVHKLSAKELRELKKA